MRTGWSAGWAGCRSVPLLALLVLLTRTHPVRGQYEPLADQVNITCSRATTWVEGAGNVVMLEGPVVIELDKNRLTAADAVVWVTPLAGAEAGQRRIEVSLVGDARLEQPNGIVRSGPRLFVSARVRGAIRLTAERGGGDRRESDLYKLADGIRPKPVTPGEGRGRWVEEDLGLRPSTQPTTQQTDRFRPKQPVRISAERFVTVDTPDGTTAAILSGKVTLLQRPEEGGFLELLADQAVVFTPLRGLKDLGAADQMRAIQDAITAAYLEGDVRIVRTPPNQREEAEQRLEASRAFYDFTTDRAVLTDVVLHTTDPRLQIPVVVRARMVRQLSENEYTAEKAKITSSSFATPSYHIGAASTYIRQAQADDPVTGDRTHFVARDTTFNVFGLPVFWLPGAAGTVTERSVLRDAAIGNSSDFGFEVQTRWGLFESFGRAPPRGLDASYRLDYYSDRGFATGLDATYAGGFVSESTLEPWAFTGELTSFLVFDDGTDRFGRNRRRVEPEDDTRGRFGWRHQHYLPGDWHLQVTAGYITDPTFMEEWFQREFLTSPPLQTSLYLKRQRESEVISFLTSFQPMDFVTTAEGYQEGAEVEKIAEVAYHRIGDSWWEDQATFFSSNTLSMLAFEPTDSTLEELGFRREAVGFQSPGLPSYGLTGTPDDTNYRADFRQEINWPLSSGRFRMVPYVVGRYTPYNEGVDGGVEQRVYAAAGLRMTTQLWKVDDSAESKLFDIHRLRHVIEPQINLMASVQSVDREDLLIYDEPIDAITDLGVVSLALNQRWQTKRGGPGRWRSVDVLRWNTSLNLFFNTDDDERDDDDDDDERGIDAFRGLFFFSQPETSVARDSVNSDVEWILSDAFRVYADVQYNLDEAELATVGAGLNVQQGRVNYYAEWRHIGVDFVQVVNGNTLRFEEQDLVLIGLTYQLTPKYTLAVHNAYDLAQNRQDRTLFSLTRQFDRFFVSVSFGTDNLDDETFFFVNVWPEGIMAPRGGSRSVTSALSQP